MEIFDISVPVYTGMACYPGDPGAVIEPVRSIAQGDIANLSSLRLGSHTGTHVDAPRHFENKGEPVDRISLQVLIGPAKVVDLTGAGEYITEEDLEGADTRGVERLLLKTRNSQLWAQPEFIKDYVPLCSDAARYLVETGVKLVGIDYLSIEQFKSDRHPVHHGLLGAGVIILEGVDLSEVPAGEYFLTCLPLRIVDGDGAPARAVLTRD